MVAPALAAAGRRRLVLAAYYGDVPYTDGPAAKLAGSWRRSGRGHVCPYLRCPECDGELVRPTQDRQRLECDCGVRIGGDEVQLNRRDMAAKPPDIVFTTAEMLNRSLANLSHGKIVGVGADRPPPLVLLDEVHTYTGTSGAQTALLLRRWAHRTKARSYDVRRAVGDTAGAPRLLRAGGGASRRPGCVRRGSAGRAGDRRSGVPGRAPQRCRCRDRDPVDVYPDGHAACPLPGPSRPSGVRRARSGPRRSRSPTTSM
jgi:hypothetical protein